MSVSPSNVVVSGICARLAEAFRPQWPDVPIHKEKVPQNLGERAFTVRRVSSRAEQILGERWGFQGFFEVRYFPKSETEPNFECADVEWPVINALEFVEVEFSNAGKVKALLPQSRVVDGVLIYTANYDFPYTRVKPKGPVMLRLKSKLRVR